MVTKDYYTILGVDRNSTREEIKKAYKRLAKRYHPDLNKEIGSAEKFKEINEAAAVLGDEKKRSHYDQYGTADMSGFQGGAGGFDFGDLGGFAGSFDFGDIFESFFGQGIGGRRRGPQRGADLRYDLEIELEDVYNGAEKHIDLPRIDQCSECDGTGAESKSDIKTCDGCGGSGMVKRTQRTPFGLFQTQSTCRNCGGSGQTFKKVCPTCRGEGRTEKRHKIKVKIPRGIDEGNMLRMPGEGEAGDAGARSGDLYIAVHIRPNNVFERKSYDLYIEVPVSFLSVALGGEIHVPTMDGKAKLVIPAGTQSNTLFRMKDKGLPVMGHDEHGDEYVKVVVHTPTNLTVKQKDLLKQLASEFGEKIVPQQTFFERLKKQFR
ncbi:molecular chaperone DnaJ [Candidatus Woesearchaeota archaeon]|nr:molecular chaperone DnaJ [Candidatus Woesearchaeota archaeon]